LWASSATTSIVAKALLLSLLVGCTDKGGPDPIEGLVGILITPDPVVVPVGGEAQLVATGLLESRDSVDLTALVNWKVSSGSIVNVRGSLDREGELEGLEAGSSTVVARYDGIASPAAMVTVTDASLLRLSVNPTAVVAVTGEKVQLSADAGFSDGSSGDVSSQVRWITGDGDIAQLQPSGVLSAVGVGDTIIHAEWEGIRSEDVPVSVSGESSGEPDLVISAMSGTVTDGVVNLSVQVENTGGASATEFWVDAWGDPGGTPSIGDIGDEYTLLSYLGPGQSETLSFELISTSSVYVLADTNDDVSESDESNNGASGTLSGGGGGGDGAPDLSVSYFDYLSDSYSLYYFVEVTNSGDVSAESFYVDIFVDEESSPEIGDDGDYYELIDSLGAGETVFVEAVLDTYCHWCWSWVLVDSLDWVSESSESNNIDGPLDVFSE
jgi:hypothetical protein